VGLLESGSVERFDRAVDRAFEPLRRQPAANRVMYAVSELADFSLLWHTISVGRAAFGGPREERQMVRLSTALGVEAALVNGPIKAMFHRARPEFEGDRPHTLRQPATSSFPSGHASAAACAVTILCDGAGPIATIGWIALGTAVATSRVHVRIHHASDIVGGAMIGLVAGATFRRLWPLA